MNHLYKRKRTTFVIFRVVYLFGIVGLMVLLQYHGIHLGPGGNVKSHPGVSSAGVWAPMNELQDRPAARGSFHRRLMEAAGPGVAETLGRTAATQAGDGKKGEAPAPDPTLESGDNHTEADKCTPPAYHEFPPDAFTTRQRIEGALVLHVVLVVYMFLALAIVCDVYFVASLEKISEKLHLSSDVAGATFMAAGSSAPELFTSILGVFVAKGDVGVGTIVGSAVFNILFVIGICGLLVTQVVMLAWWPLVRDSVFYALSVIMLMLEIKMFWTRLLNESPLVYGFITHTFSLCVVFQSIVSGSVQWYEATTMLSLYIVYIVSLVFDPPIQKFFKSRIHFFGEPAEDTSIILAGATEQKYYQSYDDRQSALTNGRSIIPPEMFTNETTGGVRRPMSATNVVPVDEYVLKSTRKLSFEDACFRFMKAPGFRPKTRFRSAVYIIICERRKLLRDPSFMRRQMRKTYSYNESTTSYSEAVRKGGEPSDPEFGDQWKRIPRIDDGMWHIVKWICTTPICILLYFTVPDCRKQKWDRWYMVSFIMSIVWIAGFSYIMVWMVALIGYTLGIPDSIMGITFLAAGTSVPDAMASVMVARNGQGDMAVSNTIGSNVFDILVGLALPWFIKTVIVSNGTSVHINSNGMVFSVVLLFLTVIITICAIHFGGWRLDKRLGVICLTFYLVFLIFSCLIEFNVFGYVNAPMCQE